VNDIPSRPVLAASAAAAVILLWGCERPPEAVKVTVEHAWVRLPAAPGVPGAAYFTLRSNSSPMTLTSVSSPQVERIELHDSQMDGGVMRMRPIATTQFPDDGVVEFKPGGKHAMLFGIDPAVKPGGKISLTFSFTPAGQIVADADVVGPAGTAPGHASH
jgi:copper(I)-binding protein